MKKITENDVKAWSKAKDEANRLEGVITDRLDYVIRTIYKTFNTNLSYWYFGGAEEGETGSIPHYSLNNDNDSFIDGIVFGTETNKRFLLYSDRWGGVIDLDDGIPSRWLYEDFEKELEQGKARYVEWNEEQKQKSKEKKLKAAQKKETDAQKHSEVIKSVMAKLSPEERKILKLK